MHPLTLYDTALDEHARQSASRDREHRITLQRRERDSGTTRRTSRTGSRRATHRDARPGPRQRSTATTRRSAADGYVRAA